MARPKVPEHLRFVSPEGIAYVAWEDDPLYSLRDVVEALELAPEEAYLPLAVMVGKEQDLNALIGRNRSRAEQLVLQLGEYGSKLTLQDVQAMTAKLRSTLIMNRLLEALVKLSLEETNASV